MSSPPEKKQRYFIDDSQFSSYCEGCANVGQQIAELKETIEKENKSLKETLTIVQIQMQQALDVMHRQTASINSLLRERESEKPLSGTFPIKTIGELEAMEMDINSTNEHIYIKAIKRILLPYGPKTGLRHILSDDIVREYNVNGSHGKKGVKDHHNFYKVFLESITGPTPEKEMKEAFAANKNRIYKAGCLARKN